MINLYRSNVARLLKNIYFIGGCIIAFAVTFAVTSGNMVIPFLSNAEPARRMFFVSAAMVVFYTIFVPVYTNADYSDGTIRNKLIAGYSQRQVFFSFLLSYVSTALIMWVCHLAGGILGGAHPADGFMVSSLLFMCALMSFISVLLLLSFLLTKTVAVVIAAGVIFTMCFNMVMFGNAILMVVSNSGNTSASYVASLVYNINVLGQWFSLTGFADDIANPGAAAQLLLSLMCMALSAIIGYTVLNNRDIV